jgi:tRNA pseudouridine13 synthase
LGEALKVKVSPEDFRVEELLKEEPKDRGEFNYYKLTKRGMESLEAFKVVARRSGVKLKELLFAGLKDKNAVTTQFVAVKRPLRLKEFSTKNLKLEFVGRFGASPRKLVSGNRFTITVRGVSPPDEDKVKLLEEFGIPNYYGEQRFTSVRGNRPIALLIGKPEEFIRLLFTPAGWENSASRRGKKLFLMGNYREASRFFSGWRRELCLFLERGSSVREGFKLVPKSELEFQFNVLQSYLFNLYLSRLVESSEVSYLKFKYRMGYLYYPTGRMELPETLPSYEPGSPFYRELVEELGFDEGPLFKYRELFHRFRRRSLVKPEEFKFEPFEGGVTFFFTLPQGAYATNILRFLYSAV